MPEVTLEFIGKQLERLLGEMAGMRDDMLVLGARMDKTEASITVLSLEVRAFANQILRMNDRIVKLEDAS
jgi:hypothetical protein